MNQRVRWASEPVEKPNFPLESTGSEAHRTGRFPMIHDLGPNGDCQRSFRCNC